MTRALIVSHQSSSHFVGGHVTQRDETVRALREAGVDARVGTPQDALTGGIDVVHVFGDVSRVLRLGRPDALLVVTPVYFPRRLLLGPDYDRPGYANMLYRRARNRASWLRRPRYRLRRRHQVIAAGEALREADVIAVNSAAEAAALSHDVRGLRRVEIVHNAVADEMFGGDPERGRQILGRDERPFVLSVARLDENKNGLALALALRPIELELGLVLVGGVRAGRQARYAESVKSAARDLTYVSHLERDQLRHVYAAAAVHALPSLYETTGLATLEALAAGTPVVVSNAAAQREYFGDCAQFTSPWSVRGVRSAIRRALDAPTGRELEVARRYNPARTARELIAAYTP